MAQDITAALLAYLRQIDPGNADDPMLTADVDLIDGGYIDSFGMVELIAYVQEQWNVDLSSVDFYEGQMRKVSGIADLIRSRIG